jgi:uncharacterized membrane-anchored protein
MTDPRDVAAEAGTLSAAFAILTVQIFPFALPLLLLCIAPLLPLVVVGLLLAAIVYPPLRLARYFRARRRRSASVASRDGRHGHRPRPRSVADPS